MTLNNVSDTMKLRPARMDMTAADCSNIL